MKSFEFLVLSFELSTTPSTISDFGFRISDLPPAGPGSQMVGEWELKTHNSKLNTDGVVS